MIRRPDATLRVVHPSTFTNIRHRPQLVFTDAVSNRGMHSCQLHAHHPTSLASRAVSSRPTAEVRRSPPAECGHTTHIRFGGLRRRRNHSRPSATLVVATSLLSLLASDRSRAPPPFLVPPSSLLTSAPLLLTNEHFATLQLPKPLHIFFPTRTPRRGDKLGGNIELLASCWTADRSALPLVGCAF